MPTLNLVIKSYDQSLANLKFLEVNLLMYNFEEKKGVIKTI